MSATLPGVGCDRQRQSISGRNADIYKCGSRLLLVALGKVSEMPIWILLYACWTNEKAVDYLDINVVCPKRRNLRTKFKVVKDKHNKRVSNFSCFTSMVVSSKHVSCPELMQFLVTRMQPYVMIMLMAWQHSTTARDAMAWALKLNSLDKDMYDYLEQVGFDRFTQYGILAAGCMSCGVHTNNWAESSENLNWLSKVYVLSWTVRYAPWYLIGVCAAMSVTKNSRRFGPIRQLQLTIMYQNKVVIPQTMMQCNAQSHKITVTDPDTHRYWSRLVRMLPVFGIWKEGAHLHPSPRAWWQNFMSRSRVQHCMRLAAQRSVWLLPELTQLVKPR